jgi:prephenate dehydrogenase
MKIGVIGGAGKMGQWFTRYLVKEEFEVVVSDKNTAGLSIWEDIPKVKVASNNKVMAEADIILLCVSIDGFEDIVKEISPLVRSGQVMVDITSVKEFPVKAMHENLKTATILGTHPLFGPGAKDLANQNFVLTPTNEREQVLAIKVMNYLQQHGARVTYMTPQKHDEMMSVVLGLSHFISIVAADTLANMGKAQELKAIGGSTYRVLTTLVESVVSEDPELYASLQMRLPYVQEMEELFQMRAAKWAEMVKNQDKAGFIKNLKTLKYKMATNDPNFGRAYENMYKIMEWL